MFDRLRTWWSERQERIAFERRMARFEKASEDWATTLALFREGEIRWAAVREAYIEFERALDEIGQDEQFLFYTSKYERTAVC
jgi:hypothetical protein